MVKSSVPCCGASEAGISSHVPLPENPAESSLLRMSGWPRRITVVLGLTSSVVLPLSGQCASSLGAESVVGLAGDGDSSEGACCAQTRGIMVSRSSAMVIGVVRERQADRVVSAGGNAKQE